MTLNIISQGQGPDLVLLHGWGFSSNVWQPLLAELAQQWCIHLVDLPGHGHSPPLPKEVTLNAYCDELADQLPQCAHYLGWSLGGIIATGLAVHHPSRVNKLILAASTPQFVCSDDWALGMDRDIFTTFKDKLRVDRTITMAKFMALQTKGDTQQKSINKTLRTLNANLPEANIKGLNDGLFVLEQCHLRDKLQAISSACLIMHGRHDTVVPIQAGEYLDQHIPNAQLTILPEAGHLPFLHDPNLFLTTLAEFLHE